MTKLVNAFNETATTVWLVQKITFLYYNAAYVISRYYDIKIEDDN